MWLHRHQRPLWSAPQKFARPALRWQYRPHQPRHSRRPPMLLRPRMSSGIGTGAPGFRDGPIRWTPTAMAWAPTRDLVAWMQSPWRYPPPLQPHPLRPSIPPRAQALREAPVGGGIRRRAAAPDRNVLPGSRRLERARAARGVEVSPRKGWQQEARSGGITRVGVQPARSGAPGRRGGKLPRTGAQQTGNGVRTRVGKAPPRRARQRVHSGGGADAVRVRTAASQ